MKLTIVIENCTACGGNHTLHLEYITLAGKVEEYSENIYVEYFCPSNNKPVSVLIGEV